MAPRLSSHPNPADREQEVLGQLLALYAEEVQVYRRVLELSRRQGEVIREGGDLAAVRRLLERLVSSAEAVAAARSDLLLLGPVDADDDPAGFVLDVAELVRCADDGAACTAQQFLVDGGRF